MGGSGIEWCGALRGKNNTEVMVGDNARCI